MLAAAPKRATNSVTLSYGPLVVPVSLYTGTEDRSNRFVKRSEYTRDGRAVGRAPIIKGSEPPEIVDAGEVVRCVETEHGLVELTDDEVAEVMDLPEKQASILTFLPLHIMGSGRYVPDSVMQVRPSKGKKAGTFDPASAAAFSLLMKAMRLEQVFALVELNLRGAPAYGALLPSGRLYRLLFDDEVRDDLPMPDFDVSMDDVEMVRQMLNVSPTPPILENPYRQLLVAYVDKKAKEGKTVDREEQPAADVDNLLGALRDAVREKER